MKNPLSMTFCSINEVGVLISLSFSDICTEFPGNITSHYGMLLLDVKQKLEQHNLMLEPFNRQFIQFLLFCSHRALLRYISPDKNYNPSSTPVFTVSGGIWGYWW